LRKTWFTKGESVEASVPAPSESKAVLNPLAENAAAAEKAFRLYNSQRRLRLEAQTGEKTAQALRMLPLLLHVNIPGLPGYVQDAGPISGVAGYHPQNTDFALAKKIFPKTEIKKSGLLKPALELIAVMGSAGTIGFTGESDLDIWVCCSRELLEGKNFRQCKRKVQEIEEWLNKYSGTEIHLFLQGSERIRQDDFGEADLEGCGSAMGALLKEEFYRTNVLIAGKIPFWWLTPPGASPPGYEEYLARLKADPGVTVDGYVDLGPVARVPLGELFGAAIWQISKGWKSPFKSALKMGLLEKTVSLGREVPPLCETLKDIVLRGMTPDPYRLLFDEVLAYHKSKNDVIGSDLLCRCFYLKTGININPDTLDIAIRRTGDEKIMADYVLEWGWSAHVVRHLNSFKKWKFELVRVLAQELDQYFLGAYQRIRQALDNSGETQQITARDLTILGRKIQTVYRRVPNKIETLHMVTKSVAESTMSICQETLPNGETQWRLYSGAVTPFNMDDKESNILKISSDILEILAWAAQNHLVGPNTRMLCKGIDKDLSAAELESLAQALCEFLRQNKDVEHELNHLLEKPRTTHLLAMPNVGVGVDNLREICSVSITSWGEVFYHRWSGRECFKLFVEEELIPFILGCRNSYIIEVFASQRKIGSYMAPHNKLRRELPVIFDFLGKEFQGDDMRRSYVGAMDDFFYIIDRSGEKTACFKSFPEKSSLLRFISGVGKWRRVEFKVESQTGFLAILKAIVETSTLGGIDVFTLNEGNAETIFISDEIGNLSYFTSIAEDAPYALAKLISFLKELTATLSKQALSPLFGRSLSEILRIHTLVFRGTCKAIDTTHKTLSMVNALGLNPMGLTIEKNASGKDGSSSYTITWGDQTIRSCDYKYPMVELRSRIMAARRSGSSYGVTVTRLFLDDKFAADYCGDFETTGHYLFYKKIIELRLSS